MSITCHENNPAFAAIRSCKLNGQKMNKLNFMGIGPKVGIFVFPWLALTVFFSLKFKDTFAYLEDTNQIIVIAGIALVSVGLVFYGLTIPSLMKGLKETKLVTTGTFYLCCNPLYASILLFVLPGISLWMNSWLVLTTSISGYIVLKVFIKSEYTEMEKFFGNEYRTYRAETPEFFPFPIRKLFGAIRGRRI